MAPNPSNLQYASFQQQQGSSYMGKGNSQSSGIQASQAKPANVKLITLPFYDQHGALLVPSTLMPKGTGRFQEAQYQFTFSVQQANDIASKRDTRPTTKINYVYQVQLRFCQLDTSKEQSDEFPPSICVQVNGKMCPLPNPIPTNKPNVEPRRPPKPIDLTPLCKLSPTLPNTVNIKWASDQGKGWVISLDLVEKLSSDQLLERLVQKGTREPEFTRELIKKKLNDEGDEIATTNLKVTVACPLGKMRMSSPCRPTTCDHLQCFDASLFLMMNEKKPTWQCPVCDSPALYENLMVDGYFLEVIKAKELPEEENEIILNQDGSWHPVPRDDGDESKKDDKDDADSKPLFEDNGSTPKPAAGAPPPEIECIDID